MIQKPMHHARLLITGLFFIIFLAFPSVALANPYGAGTYGGGQYGYGIATSVGGSSNSISNGLSGFFCSKEAPIKSPDLYQINVTNTKAKLFFVPAGNPYDRHYIAFGQDQESEGYGVEFLTNDIPGAIAYTINDLTPQTTYSFKVRGGYGCKPGGWSNTLTIKTLAKANKRTAYYIPKKEATYSEQEIAGIQTEKKIAKVTDLSNEKLIKKAKPKTNNEQQLSLLDKIVEFFKWILRIQ